MKAGRPIRWYLRETRGAMRGLRFPALAAKRRRSLHLDS
jgi:hypothetical protein